MRDCGKKPLPIGYDNFKKVISEGFYYVDKTLMIKELLDNRGQVNLFTRPRRFGKTLTLSMLRYFFEDEYDFWGNEVDNRNLFQDLRIMDMGKKYTDEMGKYPVINLSLKSAKQPTYEMAYLSLVDEIAKEYQRHSFILKWDCFPQGDREKFLRIMEQKGTAIEYAKALEFLSQCLYRTYRKNVIILIDEYDVPLENAYFRGFYKEMVDFIRSLFESALKSNERLWFAVITGCLRISKESIFTGLNNLEINSILNPDFAEHFGFTIQEVNQMLGYYDLNTEQDELKEWYDGYLFGETEVYNPWSTINYVKAACNSTAVFPKPYWANTSSNNIIRDLVERADLMVKQEIENLIEGGSIEKPIHEDITYDDIYKTQDNLWNFLFFTGYLKKVTERIEGDTIYMTLAIPNVEVRYIYRNTILEWFEKKLSEMDLSNLYQAVKEGDDRAFSDIVSKQLIESISFFDYAENYYHGFLMGLLKGCPDYLTLSNRESGNGRPDIIMKTPSVSGMAILMEIKVVKDFENMEKGCDKALEQIEKQNYEAALYKEGYRKILKYGICFYRKECLVKKGKNKI